MRNHLELLCFKKIYYFHRYHQFIVYEKMYTYFHVTIGREQWCLYTVIWLFLIINFHVMFIHHGNNLPIVSISINNRNYMHFLPCSIVSNRYCLGLCHAFQLLKWQWWSLAMMVFFYFDNPKILLIPDVIYVTNTFVIISLNYIRNGKFMNQCCKPDVFTGEMNWVRTQSYR